MASGSTTASVQSDGDTSCRTIYRIQKNLGRGAYGAVYLGVDDATGEKFAIKRVQRKSLSSDDLIRLEREIIILKTLQHPHIVSIHKVFQTPAHLTIVMDYVPEGELFDYLDNNKPLAAFQVQKLFRQITAATYFCHLNGIVHRDLKLENIFMDADANIKIGDFGFANFIPLGFAAVLQRKSAASSSNADTVDGSTSGESSAADGGIAECSSSRDRLHVGYGSRQNFLRTACGSPLYSSPEIISGRPYRGPEVDVWALGVILYCLNFGFMPFAVDDNKSMVKLKEKIVNGTYWLPAEQNDIISLIKQLLEVDFNRRATMKQVCENEWLNSRYECLSRNDRNNTNLDTKTVEEHTVQMVRDFQLTPGAELLRRLSQLSQSSNVSYKQALQDIVTNRDSSPIRTVSSSALGLPSSLQTAKSEDQPAVPQFSRATATCPSSNRRATPMTMKIGTFSKAGGSPLFSMMKPLKFSSARRNEGSAVAAAVQKPARPANADVTAPSVRSVGRFCTSPTVLDDLQHATQSNYLKEYRTNSNSEAVPQRSAGHSNPVSQNHAENAYRNNFKNISNFFNFHDDSGDDDDTNDVLINKISYQTSMNPRPIKVVDLTKPNDIDEEYADISRFRDQSYTACGMQNGSSRLSSHYADQMFLPSVDDHAAQSSRFRKAVDVENGEFFEPHTNSVSAHDKIPTFSDEYAVAASPDLILEIPVDAVFNNNESRSSPLSPEPTTSAVDIVSASDTAVTERAVMANAEPSDAGGTDDEVTEQQKTKQHIPPAYKIIVKRRTRKNVGDVLIEASSSHGNCSSTQPKLRSRSAVELRRVVSPVPLNVLSSDNDDEDENAASRSNGNRLNSSIPRRRRDDAVGNESSINDRNSNSDKPPPSFRLASAGRGNRRVVRERLLGRRHSGGGILKWPMSSSGGGCSDVTGGSASESGGISAALHRKSSAVFVVDRENEPNDNNSDDANDDADERLSKRRVVRGILKGGSLSSASHSRTNSPCTSAHASRSNVNHAAECTVAFRTSSQRVITPGDDGSDDAEDEKEGKSPGSKASPSKPTRGILKKRSKSVGANNAPRHALLLGEGAASASAVCSRRSSRCSNAGNDDAAEPQLVSMQRILNAADVRFYYDVDDDDDDDAVDGDDRDDGDVSPPLRGILKGRERSQSSDSGKVLKSILKKDGSSGHLSTSTSRSMSPVTFASHSSSLANLQQQQQGDGGEGGEDDLESAIYYHYEINNDFDIDEERPHGIDRTISFSLPDSTLSPSTSHAYEGASASTKNCAIIVVEDAIVMPPSSSTSAAAVSEPQILSGTSDDNKNSMGASNSNDAYVLRASASNDLGTDDALSFQPIDRSGSLSKRPLKSILKNRSESSDMQQQQQQSTEHQHYSTCHHARHTSFSSSGGGGEVPHTSTSSLNLRSNSYRRASSTPLCSASLTGRPATSTATSMSDKDDYFRTQRQRSCSLDFSLFSQKSSGSSRRSFLSGEPLALSSSSSSSTATSDDDEHDLHQKKQRRPFKLRSILKYASAAATGKRETVKGRKSCNSADPFLDSNEGGTTAVDVTSQERAGSSADDIEVQWVSRLMQTERQSSSAFTASEIASSSSPAESTTNVGLPNHDADAATPPSKELEVDAVGSSEMSTDEDACALAGKRFANLRVDVEPVFRSADHDSSNASDDSDTTRFGEIGGALQHHTPTTYSPPPSNGSRQPLGDDAEGSISSSTNADDINGRCRSPPPSSAGGVNNADFAGHTPRSFDPRREDRTASAANAVASSSTSRQDALFFGLDYGNNPDDQSDVRMPLHCISPVPAGRGGRRSQPVAAQMQERSPNEKEAEHNENPDASNEPCGDVGIESSSMLSRSGSEADRSVLLDDGHRLMRSSLRDSILLTRERKASVNDTAEGFQMSSSPPAAVAEAVSSKIAAANNGVAVDNDESNPNEIAVEGPVFSARVQYGNGRSPRRSTDFAGAAMPGENLQQTLLRIAEQAVASRASTRNSVSAANGSGDVNSAEHTVNGVDVGKSSSLRSDMSKAD